MLSCLHAEVGTEIRQKELVGTDEEAKNGKLILSEFYYYYYFYSSTWSREQIFNLDPL